MVPYDVYKLVHSIDKQCIVLNLDCIQKGAYKHTRQFWNTCTSTYLWHIFTLLYSWNTKRLNSLKSCTIIYLYFNMYYRNIKCLEIMYHNKFILYCTLKIPNVLKLYTIIYLYFTIYSWNTCKHLEIMNHVYKMIFFISGNCWQRDQGVSIKQCTCETAQQVYIDFTSPCCAKKMAH